MYIKNKRGQSTVEYVLLVTAVVAVIIALVAGNGGVFQKQLTNTITTATGDMSGGAGTLSTSHQPTAASNAATPPLINVDVTS